MVSEGDSADRDARDVTEAAIDDLLACPCGGGLTRSRDAVRCAACGLRYPIEDGIVDFLAGEPGEPAETSSGKEGA